MQIKREAIQGETGDLTDRIAAFIQDRWDHFFGADGISAPGMRGSGSGQGVYVELTTKCPLFNERLLAAMMLRADRDGAIVTAQGACPGTAPSIVRSFAAPPDARPIVEFDNSHFDYNCQVNLNKQKRIKIFLSLYERFPDLPQWPLIKILDYLGSDEGTRFVISYGHDLELDRYEACPHCQNTGIAAIHCGNGQPVIGFLTRKSRYYCQCGECGLVFLNPAPKASDLHRLYDWYDLELDFSGPEGLSREKLVTHNAYHDHHVRLFSHLADNRTTDGLRLLDIGGGTGRFVMLARNLLPESTLALLDFRISCLSYLQSQGIDAVEGDVLSADYAGGSFDVITLWEVIEHIRYEDIKKFFLRAERWLAPGGIIALSTPNMDSPLCRMIDFWAWFAPHHLTVLRPAILESIAQACGLKLVASYAESVLMKPGRGDLAYAAMAHASLGARAEASVLNNLFECVPDVKNYLARENIGSEMVVIFQKPSH